MKNKTTKTIACLLAGLTLTACGGNESKTNDSNSDSDSNNVTPESLSGNLPTRVTVPLRNGFLQGGANGLNASLPSGYSLPSRQIVERRGGNNANNPDGFAYFRMARDNVSYYYAGILSTTDLGPPLTEAPANVSWDGHMSMSSGASNDYTNHRISFRVDFNAGTFVGSAGNSNDGFIRSVLIDGVFGNHPNATGLNAGELGGSVRAVTRNLDFFDGSITGLIGQEGAVGVFTGAGYAGGFTASSE